MEYALTPDLAANAAARQDVAARRRDVEALSKTTDPATRRAKLHEACEGFEAIFLQKMWEQMRATLPKDGLMHSKEEEFWQSMYDQELGKSMASSGGVGLADMMMRQLDRNDGAMSDATRGSTVRRPALDVPPAPLLPPPAAAESASAMRDRVADASSAADAPVAAPVSGQGMGIYEGEAPLAGEAPAEALSSGALNAATALAGDDATPPSVRQTLDELAAQLAAPRTATAVFATDPRRTLQERKGDAPYHAARPVARPAAPTAGVAAAPATSVSAAPGTISRNTADNAPPAAPTVTRITYQTNLPPSQRKASPFATGADAMNRRAEPYRAAPLSTAARPAPAGAPATPVAVADAVPVSPPPAAPTVSAPRRATPGMPAPEQDILAGIQPRFIPTRFAPTRIAPPSLTPPATPPTDAVPGAALPTQAGGPALRGPEDIVEPVALGNPAPPRGSLSAPVSGDISSGFGWRLDPFTGRRAWHAGVDIKAAPGESVRAARPGVVAFAGEHAELGNLVVVDHGDGLRTFYGHNQELDVKPGQRVDAGTELAKAGASGRAAGTHVHFEVRRGDLALNPEPLLRQHNPQVAQAW